MKIIGKGHHSFIVDMTDAELAHLVGFAYTREPGCPDFQVGGMIAINDMYDRLKYFARHKNDLHDKAEKLRELANSLEFLNPLVPANLSGDSENDRGD